MDLGGLQAVAWGVVFEDAEGLGGGVHLDRAVEVEVGEWFDDAALLGGGSGSLKGVEVKSEGAGTILCPAEGAASLDILVELLVRPTASPQFINPFAWNTPVD